MAWRRNISVYSQVAVILGAVPGVTHAFWGLTVNESSATGRHEGRETQVPVIQLTLHASFLILIAFVISALCLCIDRLCTPSGWKPWLSFTPEDPQCLAHGLAQAQYYSPEVEIIVEGNQQVQDFLPSQKYCSHKVRGRQPNLDSKMCTRWIFMGQYNVR